MRNIMKLIKIIICIFCLTGIVKADDNISNESNRLQEFYSSITKASKNSNWWDVIYYSKIMLKLYPKNEISLDYFYYLAVAYYQVNQYELANRYFTEYLKYEFSPTYYEEVINYKFIIAKSFFNGTKKHLFNTKKMPKILSAKEDSLIIFNEVLNAMPHSEMAIESLFCKGKIHSDFDEYKESVEALQTLIKKYPKHDLAIESFLEIEKVYLKQADPKHQDPSLLDMAEINLKRFKEAFPKEERIKLAESDFLKMKEIYAQGLYEIGMFYEKTKKFASSEIYYRKIISAYPDSHTAKLSQDRLDRLSNRK